MPETERPPGTGRLGLCRAAGRRMGMNFEAQLDKYAELVVRAGLNVQQGQEVLIEADLEAAPLVRLAAKHAWAAGAKSVTVMWSDEATTRLEYENAGMPVFQQTPAWRALLENGLAERGGALLSITSGAPYAMAGIDPAKRAERRKASYRDCHAFYKGMDTGKVAWSIVGAASPKWAKAVFPQLPQQEAVQALWQAIFKAARADGPNPIAAWREHQKSFRTRIDWLNEQQFTALHYQNSIGTNITVGLPENHVWCGGGNELTDGRWQFCNMPTEEVYTSPDKDRVDGTVHSAMPLNHGGSLIDDFSITFQNGRVTNFSAAKGYDALKAILETDEGAKHLGECALIPASSPISRMGILFYSTLFDENASCHFALGKGFGDAIRGGRGMSEKELEQHGINRSATHVDFMLGTPDLSITGIKADGTQVPVFQNGNWAF